MPGCCSPGSVSRASLTSAVGATILRQSPSPRPACLPSTAAENYWILPQDAPSECENSSSARSHSNCSLATQPHLLFSSLCSCVRPPGAAHKAADAAASPATDPGPQTHPASTLTRLSPLACSPMAVMTLTLLTPRPLFEGLSLGLRRQCPVLAQGPPCTVAPRSSDAQCPEGSRTLPLAPQHTHDSPGGAVPRADRGAGGYAPKRTTADTSTPMAQGLVPVMPLHRPKPPSRSQRGPPAVPGAQHQPCPGGQPQPFPAGEEHQQSPWQPRNWGPCASPPYSRQRCTAWSGSPLTQQQYKARRILHLTKG